MHFSSLLNRNRECNGFRRSIPHYRSLRLSRVNNDLDSAHASLVDFKGFLQLVEPTRNLLDAVGLVKTLGHPALVAADGFDEGQADVGQLRVGPNAEDALCSRRGEQER